MKKFNKFLSLVLAACMIFGMLPALSASAADEETGSGNFMEIVGTGNNSYLSTVGSNAFNVLMYNNTYRHQRRPAHAADAGAVGRDSRSQQRQPHSR